MSRPLFSHSSNLSPDPEATLEQRYPASFAREQTHDFDAIIIRRLQLAALLSLAVLSLTFGISRLLSDLKPSPPKSLPPASALPSPARLAA